MGMLGPAPRDYHRQRHPGADRADRRRVRARDGPFSRRPLVRNSRRRLFHRLRPRAHRVHRPPRHTLEDLRYPARRLCALRRRRERRQHPRSGGAGRDAALRAEGALPLRAALEARGGRSRRPGGEFHPRHRRIRGGLLADRPPAHPADRRHGDGRQRRRASRDQARRPHRERRRQHDRIRSPSCRASSCSRPTSRCRSSSSGTARR